MTEILLTTISALLSYALTAGVRSYALRYGVLDRPNDRSSHREPTPRGGGIAVILAAVVGMAVGVALGCASAQDVFPLSVGVTILCAIGWVDDRGNMRANVRLTIHFCVALWTLYMLRGLPALRVGHLSLELAGAGYVLGAVGIVWSINLFNFMDGIDGLAGSQATLIFTSTGLLLLAVGDKSLGTIALVIAAAAMGFSTWNWPPAKIFLGDAGSGSLGYAVAALAIASENNGSVPLVTFAIVGGVFIADATVTLLRRISRGKRPTDAHRDHAYQRLARTWGHHKPVSQYAGYVTIVLIGISAIGMIDRHIMIPALVIAYVLLAILLLAIERRAPM